MIEIGLLFISPTIVKYIFSVSLSKQELVKFYRGLPEFLSFIIQNNPVFWAGVFIFIFIFIFFRLIKRANIPGLIYNKKIVQDIIYSGKKIKVLTIDKQKSYQITVNRVPSTVYVFSSTEFDKASYTTMNNTLDLTGEQYVYWNPEHPQLVIPEVLLSLP